MTAKIKILLVDDHNLLRDALAMALKQEPDFEVVGSLASGEEAINKLTSIVPHVVIMDIMMPGITGIEATRWIKERAPEVKIIILSMEVKTEFISAGIQSGIDGYLPKNIDKSILIDAIRKVHAGEKVFYESVTRLIFEDFYVEKKQAPSRHVPVSGDLTKREVEILKEIASGKTNKEIAHDLQISIKTVDTHKTHILEKLSLRTTAELVKYAIKNKFITID